MREKSDAWADVYDAVHVDVHKDVPFYVEMARESGGPVLELGCGTGRVTFKIAAAGIEITGIDISPAMLKVAKDKAATTEGDPAAATLVEASMSDFNLGQRFSLTIVPFHGFQSLLTVPEQISTLAAVKRHLEPGGLLAFDMFVPEPSTLVQDQDVPYHLKDVTDPKSGVRRVLYQQSAYDNFAQLVHARIIIEELDAFGVVARKLYREFSLRYSYRWEIRHLLASCGFDNIQVYGGFDGSELDESSDDMVWTARSP